MWLYCSFNAEMSGGALKASQVCQSGFVAVVAGSAVVAVVLIDLFGLRVPCAELALVLSFRIQNTITDWRTVVTHGAFVGGMISLGAKITRLTTGAFVDLLRSRDHTLSFEWTIHRPVVAFWTVVTSSAFFPGWVWLNGVVVFSTKIAGGAVIRNQVCPAIVGGCADGAVCVC